MGAYKLFGKRSIRNSIWNVFAWMVNVVTNVVAPFIVGMVAVAAVVGIATTFMAIGEFILDHRVVWVGQILTDPWVLKLMGLVGTCIGGLILLFVVSELVDERTPPEAPFSVLVYRNP
ncbi:MAG: hypothetical protein WD603_01150 [Patescibacteria group bacterium]